MKEDKKLETILVLVIALIVTYWIFEKPYLLVSSFILGVIGMFFKGITSKIHWAWMKLSHILGAIMSKVLLTIVFLFIVIPLALLAKLSGRRNMILKPSKSSYFKNRNFTYNKESLENIW